MPSFGSISDISISAVPEDAAASGVTHDGAASLTCVSSLSIAALVTHNAISSRTCVSSLTSTANVTHNGITSLSEISSFSATSLSTHNAIAGMSCISSLTVTALVTHYGFASIVSVSSLTATAMNFKNGVASLVGVCAINAEGTRYTPLNIDFTIEWNDLEALIVDKEFLWDTGELPIRWYRVQGVCNNASGSTGIQTDDVTCLGKQVQFIQTIAARNLTDLCEQLTKSRINWSLQSVKVWSRPADNRLVEDNDQVNTLSEISWQHIPNCLSFNIQTETIINMKVSVGIIQVIGGYEGNGTVYTSGEAETNVPTNNNEAVPSLTYDSEGGEVLIDGEADVFSSWNSNLLVNIKVQSQVNDLEVVFGNIASPVFVFPETTVNTRCNCLGIPVVLHLFHNLENAGILFNFMQRNGLTLTNPFVLHYSKKLGSWLANYHATGIGSNNTNDNETWRITFEWSCLSDIAGTNLESYYWKLSMLAVRKELNNQAESRMMIIFPPEQICEATENLGFDFSFKLNTKTSIIQTNIDVGAEVVLLNDGIGLFKSTKWLKNPNLSMRLSKNNIPSTTRRKDISPIFPKKVLQTV